VFAIPGGFSFGDHLGSARVLASRIRMQLHDELKEFVRQDKLILGICNGFQVLVKTGLLPNLGGEYEAEATLVDNLSGHYEDRWVSLAVVDKTISPWLAGISSLRLPVRHGEGQLVFRSEDDYKKTLKQKLASLRYVDAKKKVTQHYPENPNGSIFGIASLTDPSGKIFGLMPHPEANTIREHEPGWNRGQFSLVGSVSKQLKKEDGAGMAFFYNAAAYFKPMKIKSKR
jgi:phosphoribosylformylglycinamidine synthase